jgi:hypothetical protein
MASCYAYLLLNITMISYTRVWWLLSVGIGLAIQDTYSVLVNFLSISASFHIWTRALLFLEAADQFNFRF